MFKIASAIWLFFFSVFWCTVQKDPISDFRTRYAIPDSPENLRMVGTPRYYEEELKCIIKQANIKSG